MAKTYRVGIIGCGGMGRSHAGAYAKNEATEVVAAMDIDEGAVKRLGEQFSIPALYTDRDEMLEKEELDIISIPTWQIARADVTVAAAKSGVKAIMGEKPMADSLGGADAMIEACEKNNVKLAIGHQRRFDAANNEVRRLVADGAIGQPIFVHKIGKRRAGLFNTATHDIDGWRYILSDPKTLWVIGQMSRTTDRWERRGRCEDLCMGLVCFEGGTRGIYEGDLPESKVTVPLVTGTEGKIKIGEGDVVLLQNDKVAGWKEITPPPVETNQFQELIDWMEGKVPDHRNNGQTARCTLEIMLAFHESLRIKNVVTMPMENKGSPLDMMVEDGTLPVLVEGRYDIRKPFPQEKKK